MRTAITSSGNNPEANFDLRFGRAAWFCIIDHQSGEVGFKENNLSDASNGAGTKAAEKMAEMGISRVISGDFGPKARDLLDRLGIQMVILSDETLKVKDVINKMKTQ